MLCTVKVNGVAGDETRPLFACQDHYKMTQVGHIMREGPTQILSIFHSKTKKNNPEDFRAFCSNVFTN